MKIICLSHTLNNELTCYNGEKNIKITTFKGNEKKLSMALHSGTHIDFPLHVGGIKASDDYSLENFIFTKPYVIEIKTKNDYIQISDIKDIPNGTDLLIFKVNRFEDRNCNEYAINNIGISSATAKMLRLTLPKLRAIGINSISINAYQNKEDGRLAHKELLGNKPEILIIEDMKLDEIQEGKLNRVIVAPLIIDGADGVPVTIFAEVEE